MLFDALFITLFVIGWLATGFLPWLALSVATCGNAGFRYLFLSMAAAVIGGLAVPVFRDDGLGLILSFVVAFVLPTLLLTARRVLSRRWPGARG